MQYSLTVDSTEPALIARRPSLVNSLLEFRFPIEAAVLLWNYGIKRLRPQVDDSNRKIVMMIPGFMAGDLTLAPLAKFCEWLGHKTFFTGSGRIRDARARWSSTLSAIWKKFTPPLGVS